MRETWANYRVAYRRYWNERAPGGAYRLGFSAFVARAMQEAFKDVEAWLPTIRNDARKEPIEGGREQVGLVWPVEVEEQVLDLWESLDPARFPDGFSLTKQHLAAAAILHGLRSVNEWVWSVDNDDRFSVPVDNDNRLKRNRVLLGTDA